MGNKKPETPNEDSAIGMQLAEMQDSVAQLYGNQYANVGTEEMGQEDVNTPYLILMQTNTDLENNRPGSYYRSDTKEMMESVDVNFVYVTTKELINKKGEPYTAKEYYGFFAGTKEPFKLKMKGWGLASHRELQTEVLVYRAKFNVPMLSLSVRLTSERKEGLTKNGDQYKIEKIVCNVLKDESDPNHFKPAIETDPDRVGFLMEAVERFRKIAPNTQDEEGV